MEFDLDKILAEARTVAVVGCSDRRERTSNRIARYLKSAGFRIIPVNPYHTEVLGETCYPSVNSIDDNITVDIVDVFRRPEFTSSVVADVLERVARLGTRPVIWTQIGVSSELARLLATSNGLQYVANRCTMVEHARTSLPR
jgi:predicted CoA-binding protein